MATPALRRKENVLGNFYVDSSCIDCDTCRWLAPAIFTDIGDQSAVFHQPETDDEETLALYALLACPTASIGTAEKSERLKIVRDLFPLPLEENVYYCGFHAEASFGAASYFIKHPDGNILIDSPRFVPSLVKRLEELGGVRTMFLTHQDDVADHQKFHDHFHCERWIHHAESRAAVGAEKLFSGDTPISLTSDALIIPSPGHTRGSSVLLYRNKFLFTGDHLAYSERLKNLYAFRSATWFSWQTQIASMQKLLDYSFEWVLPGHGRRLHTSKDDMHQQLKKCIDWMTLR
jgi:glyoxylase-like metal-dependent hydrolase (beta-lactamase superfamily II)/ferredoxin